LKNRQVKTAEKLFQNILQTWPKFIGALKGTAEVENIKRRQALYADYYFDLKKLGIAQNKYNELISEYPEWPYSYIQLGKVKLAREDYATARKHFQTALDLNPNDPMAVEGIDAVREVLDSALFQADQLLKGGDFKAAALIYADYIEEQGPKTSITPQLAHAYNGLGWCQFQKKRYSPAVKKFELARTQKEFYLESSRGLGLSLYKLGEFKRAADALAPVVAANPDQT
ncbi:MAG: tetratricopeptide repeat protein, partial [Nitrospinae bacterium]|nr:tetratricopeptide repeat protein [Nitrospinota bacterium]